MQQFMEFISNHLLLSAAWIVIFLLIAYSYVTAAMSPVKALSTHEATLLMNNEDAVILDMREVKAYNTGHILGAKHLKPEVIKNKQFGSLEKFKDKPIILVCALGNLSKSTANELIQQGFEKTSILQGGMSTWEAAGLPVSK
ncbi:rhodanese-like domain-containing protein [Alteromonas sp. 5E99-2]|uniref:rhodanese-like domain-containing protein n=1 Tax=Alteromonas sp. 5E99-2 TaxID=2817683 RepID=UPI001A99B70C|nr:rhodanese-like domain-containing protein [Alteromonas sp. 5E99-2]MBO1254611.1 rhodanese-like domain-containing protein [Alteromonas sp. 5E99-2]